MNFEFNKDENDNEKLTVSEKIISFDDVNLVTPQKNINLFQLYKEGKIDTNIFNTQEERLKSYKVQSSNNPIISGSTSKPLTQNTGKLGNTSKLIVSSRQKGNVVLNCIRNVFWEFSEIDPDFIVGSSHCVLFLSLKYHNTKPTYIYNRIRELKSSWDLKVLLVLVDEKDSSQAMRELNKLCISNHMTLLLAWSDEEIARYLESYKVFENKPPDILLGETIKSETTDKEDEMSGVVKFLSSISSINKSDARTLVEKFGTIEAIITADLEALKSCSGLGVLKAKNIFDIFRKPLIKKFNDDIE